MHQIVLTPYAKTFYSEWKLNPDRSDYNICLCQDLHGDLQVKKLQDAINRFAKDYVLFDSHINIINQEHFWVKNKVSFEAEYFEKSLTMQEIILYVKQAFDLEEGPLFRFAIIRLAENQYKLIFVMHHILISGSSGDFIFNELSHYYNNVYYKAKFSRSDQIEKLEKLAKDMKAQLHSNQYNSQKFWKDKLTNIEAIDWYMLKPELTEKNENNIGVIQFVFDKDYLTKLNLVKNKYSVSPYLFGQVIYALLLHRYTGQDKFCICYPIAIKEGMDFIYGAQVNTNAIPYDFTKINNAEDLLLYINKYVQELKNSAANPAYLPITQICKLANQSYFNIFFNKTNLKSKVFEFDHIHAISINEFDIDLLHEVIFEQEIRDDQIHYKVRYRKDLVDFNLLSEFIACYRKLFIEILEELCN